MARRRRRSIEPLTLIVAIVAGLVIVALVALQLRGDRPTVNLAPEDVQRIAPQDAKDLADRGEAALFDVRSEQAYLESHADGAFLYPEIEEDDLFAALPGEGALIFY